MSKQKFSESQIRQIIEKSFQISQKNNGVIPLDKLEDAATFAAYIAGYSSWKQYRKSQKQDFTFAFTEIEDQVAIKEFNPIKIETSSEKIQELKNKLLSIKKRNINTELKSNKQILFKIECGTTHERITKSINPYYIHAQNTCFVGSNNNFLDNVKKSINHQLQTIIEFSGSSKIKDKLDPINEIIYGEHFEDFFTNNIDEHRDFSFLWVLLIKQIAQQYKIKFTLDLLIETLELDFILKSWYLLSQEENFLANMLLAYLKTLSLKQSDLNYCSISKESQINHWKNVRNIYSKLLLFQQSYDDGVFSYEGLELSQCFIEKRNADFFIPNKVNNFIIEVVNFISSTATYMYHKTVDGYDIKEHSIFLINKHKELNKNLYYSEYIINLNKISSINIEELGKFEQIVFSKHDAFVEPNVEFIKKFYLETPNIKDNLFANSGAILINLNDNEAYVWQKENKETIFGPYVINKIND